MKSQSDNNLEKREPGFNSLPDPVLGKAASTDGIEDTVSAILENIEEEATGRPAALSDSKNKSKEKSP